MSHYEISVCANCACSKTLFALKGAFRLHSDKKKTPGCSLKKKEEIPLSVGKLTWDYWPAHTLKYKAVIAGFSLNVCDHFGNNFLF